MTFALYMLAYCALGAGFAFAVAWLTGYIR